MTKVNTVSGNSLASTYPLIPCWPWWRHQMETLSVLLAFCAGNSPVTGEFPAQRPATRSFDVFFDLHLNKWLSNQSWGWWSEMSLYPLWCHCNAKIHMVSGHNSLRPGDVHIHQWGGSSLVEVMNCHLVTFKPLSESILTYCPLSSQVKIESKYQTFQSTKRIWKCHLENVVDSLQGAFYLKMQHSRVGFPTLISSFP